MIIVLTKKMTTMYTLNINNPEKFFCPKTGEQLNGPGLEMLSSPALLFYEFAY